MSLIFYSEEIVSRVIIQTQGNILAAEIGVPIFLRDTPVIKCFLINRLLSLLVVILIVERRAIKYYTLREYSRIT